ncbi:MAG: molybdopterin-dependent oxidoreductase, partial [Candidatus Rokubacteria bacterium]|nr:molybdopterin-dependent oxidoreductase [Candidatus Rokubacteria bacterium]
MGAGRSEEADAELAMHGAEGGGAATKQPAAPNVGGAVRFARGDVARGFREADVIVERRYTTSMVHQGYLEPRAAVAAIDPLGQITVWSCTQALFFTRGEVARTLGVPEHRVRMIAMPIGGGFGGKFVLLEPLAAALAVAVRRPVSLVMTRTEEFLSTTPAPASIIELKIGATRDGRLTALQGRVIFDAGAFSGAPVNIACLMLGAYYRVPHLAIEGCEVLTHKPGSGAYRAPGAVQATFALESQMDELAAALGMDPLELRRLNAAGEGDPLPTGKPWPRMGMRACLDRLAERYRAKRASVTRGTGSVRRGLGVAVGGWMGGIEPATAVCKLDADGSISVLVGSVDLSGTTTTLTQIAAEAFGIPVERVRVVNGDSDTAPHAGATGGSKITYTLGAAVLRAAEDARRQLLRIAASHLEAAVEDLELIDDRVSVRGMPDRAVSLAKIAELCMTFGAQHEPVYWRGSTATVARAPAFAVHMAEVEVDVETGRVRLLDHLVVQDVGRALNPAAIDGQIGGAVSQGAGWALLERMAYDAGGRLMSATLMDYALPNIDQVPRYESVLVEVPSELGPYGAKGVGEPPVVAAGAAIANAIADATGRRFAELPIVSEAIVRAAAAR